MIHGPSFSVLTELSANTLFFIYKNMEVPPTPLEFENQLEQKNIPPKAQTDYNFTSDKQFQEAKKTGTCLIKYSYL